MSPFLYSCVGKWDNKAFYSLDGPAVFAFAYLEGLKLNITGGYLVQLLKLLAGLPYLRDGLLVCIELPHNPLKTINLLVESWYLPEPEFSTPR